VIGIDRDPVAVEAAKSGPDAIADPRFEIVHASFAQLPAALAERGIGKIDGLLLDLGVSSPQIDTPERGFSFRFDGPLDMRMDTESGGVTAADVVNTWSASDLEGLIREYGEERFARGVAASIVRERAKQPLTTTTHLREAVERAIPRRYWPKRIHPATRTFQALRIEVNHELDSIERGLQAAISELRPGGRLGVIAFHSLEDILVKNALHVAAQNCVCPPQQPICTCAHRASLFLLTRKATKADPLEIATNPRARSARLRVAEKLDSAG
jgi:16S rRNA (cytosine1402-N4)-methyltransferase